MRVDHTPRRLLASPIHNHSHLLIELGHSTKMQEALMCESFTL